MSHLGAHNMLCNCPQKKLNSLRTPACAHPPQLARLELATCTTFGHWGCGEKVGTTYVMQKLARNPFLGSILAQSHTFVAHFAVACNRPRNPCGACVGQPTWGGRACCNVTTHHHHYPKVCELPCVAHLWGVVACKWRDLSECV